jgi:putative solute:sodium symporter small subunit
VLEEKCCVYTCRGLGKNRMQVFPHCYCVGALQSRYLKKYREDLMNDQNDRTAYWKANLQLVTVCLVIWFFVSYVCGILLVEPLNTIRVGGYKLGFWFAQQGSIYTFVALIFFYAARMNVIDKKFNVHED